MAGGKPVFADIENKSFGLDPKDVINKITDKTVAIMPIHYGGTMCDISLKDIAKDKGLLTEDAAESLEKHMTRSQPVVLEIRLGLVLHLQK